MKKVFIIIGIIMLLVAFSWLVLRSQKSEVVTDSNNIKTNQQISNETRITNESTTPDLILGNSTAPITITEYADFKCPTCNKFVRSTYQELKREYLDTGMAKIVFRNLPFIAADSQTAAEGAYCANLQGKFSAYHDLLYNHIWDQYYSKGKINEGEFGDVFTVPQLVNIVGSIGIDSEKFASCLESGQFKDFVASDLSMSERDGATGTPTFIVGKQKIIGAQPFGIFNKLIQAQQ